MARKSKIRFEWDGDHEGRLWAIRDKGKITFDELIEAINDGYAFQGRVFTMTFRVDQDLLEPVGWMGENEPEGDVWELWEVEDGGRCPVCGRLVPPQYCPNCGSFVFPLTEMGGEGNEKNDRRG